MKIHLHIDRLVVEGAELTASQREQLGASLQAHLAALLKAAPDGCGLLAGANVARLATPLVELTGRPEPRLLGHGIGDAVGGALLGEGPSRTVRTEYGTEAQS